MGAIADVVGSKRVFLAGSLWLAAFTLSCDLSITIAQLITFRALQGVSVAICLPTSVAILSNTIPPGRRRNLGFACTGLGQPLGFSLGLVLGGVFVNTVGWRVGWYIVAAIVSACVLVGFFLLTADTKELPSFSRLRAQVDWPGVLLISASLAMLTYVLLQLSENQRLIHGPTIIALLTISLVLVPAFIYWVQLAARRHRPVLIPNALWKQTTFTGICVMVMLSYAVMQVLELYCTLFFQKVQGLDALQSSIRLLPSLIIGALLNLTTGLFIHRVSTLWLVLVSSLACSGSSLFMALINPAWPYWYAAFPAQILEPLSADVLFCAGLIVISETFPDDTQALAGVVFNTAGQFGQSLGLAIISIIANSVTESSGVADKKSPEGLERGYRVAFWTTFGMTLSICVVGGWTLRGVKTHNLSP